MNVKFPEVSRTTLMFEKCCQIWQKKYGSRAELWDRFFPCVKKRAMNTIGARCVPPGPPVCIHPINRCSVASCLRIASRPLCLPHLGCLGRKMTTRGRGGLMRIQRSIAKIRKIQIPGICEMISKDAKHCNSKFRAVEKRVNL